MVTVASFVVQPGAGIAEFLALGGVWGAYALEVTDTGHEFGRGIFGEIVCQSLTYQADFEAEIHDSQFVFCDGAKVLYRVFGVKKRSHRKNSYELSK